MLLFVTFFPVCLRNNIMSCSQPTELFACNFHYIFTNPYNSSSFVQTFLFMYTLGSNIISSEQNNKQQTMSIKQIGKMILLIYCNTISKTLSANMGRSAQCSHTPHDSFSSCETDFSCCSLLSSFPINETRACGWLNLFSHTHTREYNNMQPQSQYPFHHCTFSATQCRVLAICHHLFMSVLLMSLLCTYAFVSACVCGSKRVRMYVCVVRACVWLWLWRHTLVSTLWPPVCLLTADP